MINEKKAAARAGRPRDPKVDGALLDAALEVFLERGYHSASLSEIARRAGVGTPAIYRRWRTKAEVGVDVIRRQAQPAPIPDTGSIRQDLVAFVRQRIKMFGGRLFHYLLVPLVTDPGLSATVQASFLDYRQPLALWSFFFGLWRAGRYQGKEVRATGWYRRAPVPYLEIYRLEVIDGSEPPRRCYTYYARLIGAAVLMALGAVIALFAVWA